MTGQRPTPEEMRQTRIAFFQSLPSRAASCVPLWISGTIRIDLADDSGTERWYVELGEGKISVHQDDRERSVQSTIATTFALFDAVIRGEVSVISPSYREDFGITGQLPLYNIFRRFFGSTPLNRDPRIKAQESGLHGLLWRESLEADLARHREGGRTS